MKKAFVILLCALALFAIVSCKQDPPAPETFTVFFNSEGGTEIAPVTVQKDAKIEEPADPVKVGSYFCGWFTDPAFEHGYDFSEPVTKTFSLYAKWEEGTIYRVTSLDYTSADGNKYDKFIVSFPDAAVDPGDVVSITFRTTEPFTQYSIRRYSDNKKFFHEKSKGDYPQFFTAMESGEDGWTTVTYVFPKEGAATQDADASKYPEEGGIGFNVYFRNQKMVPGAYMELKAVAINGKEYVLTEESVNPDLGNVRADFEVISWVPRTVTFDTNGGSEIPAVTVPFGQPVAEPATDPTKEGVLFYGWFADKDCNEEFDFGTLIFKDTTVYAKYAPPVTVSFETNGGSEIGDVTIPSGYTVDEPEDPEREGFLFVGWFSDVDLTEEYDFEDEVTDDLTLYAKWTNPANLTYNFNYEGSVSKVVVVEKNASIDPLDQLGRPGYFFDGWFNEAECKTAFDNKSGITEDTVVYAKWVAPTKTYKYTVTSLEIEEVEYECDRIGLRWKHDNSSVVAAGLELYNFKKDDVITFKVKSTPDTGKLMSTIRLRTKDGGVDFYKYYTISEAAAGEWMDVTLVLGKDTSESAKGLILAFYDDKQGSGVKEGDVLEIMGVALNGVELPITDSDGCGLYPNFSTSDKYWYGAPATKEEIPLLQ